MVINELIELPMNNWVQHSFDNKINNKINCALHNPSNRMRFQCNATLFAIKLKQEQLKFEMNLVERDDDESSQSLN